MKLLISLISITLFCTGCASAKFTSTFEITGKFDPEQSERIEKQAEELSWEDAKTIDVYIGELPEGIIWNGQTFSSDKYIVDVIGKSHTNTTGGIYWNYPEDEKWRNRLCPVNIPLAIATLGVWYIFSPTSWVCMRGEDNSVERTNARKLRLVNTLKKSALAAKGNVLFITSLGRTDYVNTHTNETVRSLDMTNAEGIILSIKPKVKEQVSI